MTDQKLWERFLELQSQFSRTQDQLAELIKLVEQAFKQIEHLANRSAK